MMERDLQMTFINQDGEWEHPQNKGIDDEHGHQKNEKKA